MNCHGRIFFCESDDRPAEDCASLLSCTPQQSGPKLPGVSLPCGRGSSSRLHRCDIDGRRRGHRLTAGFGRNSTSNKELRKVASEGSQRELDLGAAPMARAAFRTSMPRSAVPTLTIVRYPLQNDDRVWTGDEVMACSKAGECIFGLLATFKS